MVGSEPPFERPARRILNDDSAARGPGTRHRGRYLDNELPLRRMGQWRRDGHIARSVVAILQASHLVPEGRVWVLVRDGWVTLKGEADWDWQRIAAGAAARRLTGVRGVINSIYVTPR